ncbi:transglutaminase-like domain-containing protein [Zongyangia hominis]|uniref:Transglutaminase domain-containing protein n=1 Tax=Zongyangia hominis TaxID=2763677 RepID=A0A926EFZ9_9FIRM|nr:transglutaminase-like domain-containing protein [Zongyangia hominis]MBC8571371.1 transglutaminase domain-containing protein [Zongyangia hominis]
MCNVPFPSRAFLLALASLLLVFLAGCGEKSAPPSSSSGEQSQPPGTAVSNVLTPTASGVEVLGNERVEIDASNASQGYLMIRYLGENPKVKLRTQKDGSPIYTYALNSDGAYETFPLSEGDGAYTVTVYENVSGKEYATAFSTTVNVTLENEFIPFLYPNQYVNFSAGSQTVQKGAQLAATAGDEIGVIENIYHYCIDSISYDTEKAKQVEDGRLSGYLPQVDEVLASGQGICFDYAAVMCAMLRSQSIPTKLVVGYSGEVYHSWLNVYSKEEGWIDGVIYFDGKSWKLMDPTFASGGKDNPEILKYIGDGDNYTPNYIY